MYLIIKREIEKERGETKGDPYSAASLVMKRVSPPHPTPWESGASNQVLVYCNTNAQLSVSLHSPHPEFLNPSTLTSGAR